MITFLKDEKDKLIDLQRNLLMFEMELNEIKSRKQVYIRGSEYNNGIFLNYFEIGYEETVNFLEMMIKRYRYEVDRQERLVNSMEYIHQTHEEI